MHKYLRAIGFSRYKGRREERKLLQMIEENPTDTRMGIMEGELHIMNTTEFGPGFGVKSMYYADDPDGEVLEYYFPYVNSDVVSTNRACEIERHSSELSFSGSYDEAGMELSVIFYLNNGVEMADYGNKNQELHIKGVSLTALARSGKILLPLYKTDNDENKSKATSQTRNRLLEAARNGDEKAMETLAMADMSIIQNIQTRILKEDVYTMVDTCFMPYGMESDAYLVIGEIQKASKVRNRVTGEECWQLVMDCNGIRMMVMLNAEDLLGDPQPGRRFKGEVWLQGRGIVAGMDS